MTNPQISTFSAYVPLSKFEEKDDGTLLVFGRATQEILDSHGEIMDYESSAPLFRMRAEQNAQRSGGENLMPLRAMHQPVSAGKVIQFDFNDEEKAIDIVSHVVDAAEIQKVREKVYTGFSVGGRYARRWADPASGYSRFTADPGEVSLVDAPSVPTAKFDLFKIDFESEPAEQAPAWVGEFQKNMNRVRDLLERDAREREDRLEKMKTLGERVGIAWREGSPLYAPKDCPDVETEYGDPANYSFLMDEHSFLKNVSRFNSGNELQKYSPKERHILGRRISMLASRFGEEYQYLPEESKITRKERTMSDLNKLDVGAVVAGLKGQAASASNLAATDPKAALASIMGYIDSLTVGQNISGHNVPVVDPSRPLAKSEHTEPDGDEGPQVDIKVEPKKDPELDKAAEPKADMETDDLEKSAAFQSLKADVAKNNQTVGELSKSINSLLEALTKAAAPVPTSADPNSPVNALNSIVQNTPTPEQNIFAHPAIVALEEGGPYALHKALKHVQDESDPNGSLAFQRLNDLIRKASYTSLEQGGVVTSRAHMSKLYQPGNTQ